MLDFTFISVCFFFSFFFYYKLLFFWIEEIVFDLAEFFFTFRLCCINVLPWKATHSQNLVSVQKICQWALSVFILRCFILSSAVLKIFVCAAWTAWELVRDHYSQIEIYTVKMVTGWWIKCCYIEDEYIFLFRAIWGLLSNWQRSNLKTFCCSFYRNATALLILKSDIWNLLSL